MGELSPEDEKFIGPIVYGLRNKINRENSIGARKMCSSMKLAGYVIDAAKIREIIHVIRVRGLVKCLVHGPKGYYITASMQDGQRFTGQLRKHAERMDMEEKALTQQFNEYYSPGLFH